MKTNNWLFLMGVSLYLASCVPINLYEKQVPIPATGWSYDLKPNFTFDIKDTTSQFMIYAVIRHTDQYPFNNLWIELKTQAPDADTARHQKLNLQLATSDRWEGTGVNDIYEVRKLISNGPVSFKSSGIYSFTMSQIMRENPLKYVLNVGIRVEKVN